MNSYNYRITNEIYNLIVNGTKRIEIRLYNDKSSKINIGDYINFAAINSRISTVATIGFSLSSKSGYRVNEAEKLSTKFILSFVLEKI